ncbi:MAG: hypothetical protein CML02_21040 [Pseudooceanicola sp.]|nr:hypothetical protein [Pseudooceanicola sp.]
MNCQIFIYQVTFPVKIILMIFSSIFIIVNFFAMLLKVLVFPELGSYIMAYDYSAVFSITLHFWRKACMQTTSRNFA